jgi:hypothetical protein
MSFVGLWEARIRPALRERRGGLWLGDGVKSRKLTSGDPCCRGEYEVHLFGHSRDFVGDGGGAALATLRRAARQYYSLDSSLGAAASKYKPAVSRMKTR